MNTDQTVGLSAFKVAGIFVRTTNSFGQSQKDISLLWNRFNLEGITGKIPNRLSDDVYCMYSAYEETDRGEYDTLIGCRVSSISDLPEWLRGMEVPALRYKIFESQPDSPDSVINTWIEIWSTELPRLFRVDFDLYPADKPGSAARNILTYVSITE